MRQISIFLIALLAICFTSCNDDDDNDPGGENEEEEITTVVATFSSTGSPDSEFRFKIEDGTITEQDQITLMANTTYTVALEFLNEEETPTEDVTEEILEEDDEHLICFTTTATGLTFTYDDMDDNGLEVGLASTWMTGDAVTGEVVIELLHQPDLKNTSNTIDCTAGEADVEATFPIVIQ